MARVEGKCPHCGATIHLNDEKIKGFCAQCGKEVDVQESISLNIRASERAAAPSDISGVAQRRQEREQVNKERAKAADIEKKIHNMFQMCSTEEEFLGLRSKIISSQAADDEKAALLEALDSATKERLKDVLEKAGKYQEAQKSPKETLLGAIAIVIIGFIINYFSGKSWPGIVGLVLGVFAVIGRFMETSDKTAMAENERAAKLIEVYRSQGYKL